MVNCRLCSRLCRDFLPLDTPVAYDTAEGLIITNEAFLRRSAAWAAGFSKRKAEGAVSTALFFENTIEFAAALFGAWRVGLHTLLLSDALPATMEKLRDLTAVGCTAGDCWSDNLPAVSPIEGSESSLFAERPLNPEAPLLSLLTSGSTGEPKVVSKRLEQLFIEVEGIDRVLSASVDSNVLPVVFATVTHQHIYGLLFRALWPLLGKGLMTPERLHYPETLAAAMKAAEDHPQMLVSSPAHLKRLDDPAIFTESRESLCFLSSSAGPLDETGARKAYDAFGRFPFEILGSTETGGIAMRMRHLDDRKLQTPAWLPMPGVEIGIETAEGIVSCENLSRADTHWPVRGRLALKTRQLAGKGFEKGGDDIELCADGSFSLIGRSDRIVKVEGKRVSLALIEKQLGTSALLNSPKALLLTGHRDEIAVAAELSPEGRNFLFKNGKPALTRTLRSLLIGSIDPVALPKRWRFVERMPVNAQGKTPLSLLTRLFDTRRLEWFTIAKETGEIRSIRLLATIPTHLAWFRGHFPGRPILPGVGILKLTDDAARECFGFPGTPGQVRNLKFKAMIKPGMTMVLEMTEKKAGEIRFSWKHRLPDDSLLEQASGILSFNSEGN